MIVPPLISHVWSCKKSVVLSICHFVYAMKIHKYEMNIFIREICSQHHTIWSFKYIGFRVQSLVRIYCLIMMVFDAGNWYLV
jgi:hypothetical protein